MQLPLSLPGLYDSGRMAGALRQPATRGECAGGKAERESGSDCPHVLCRYHLLGELARRPAEEAVAAMVARLEGRWRGSCALDIAEDGGMDGQELSEIIGVSRARAEQITYEASSRWRRRLAAEGIEI